MEWVRYLLVFYACTHIREFGPSGPIVYGERIAPANQVYLPNADGTETVGMREAHDYKSVLPA